MDIVEVRFEESNKSLMMFQKTPKMPDTMSSELKDLILKLIAKEPERRLGHKGAEEVKSHPFFKGIHWEDVLKKRLRPPFVPTLTSQQDVRYFRDVLRFLKEKYENNCEFQIGDASETPTPGESLKNNDKAKRGHDKFAAFSYADPESQTQSLKDSTKFGSPTSDKENTDKGNHQKFLNE